LSGKRPAYEPPIGLKQFLKAIEATGLADAARKLSSKLGEEPKNS